VLVPRRARIQPGLPGRRDHHATFEVAGSRPAPLAIHNTRRNVENAWVYLDMTLVDEKSGEKLAPRRRRWRYYAGVDEGESWSEGGRRGPRAHRERSPGRYHVRSSRRASPRAGGAGSGLRLARCAGLDELVLASSPSRSADPRLVAQLEVRGAPLGGERFMRPSRPTTTTTDENTEPSHAPRLCTGRRPDGGGVRLRQFNHWSLYGSDAGTREPSGSRPPEHAANKPPAEEAVHDDLRISQAGGIARLARVLVLGSCSSWSRSS